MKILAVVLSGVLLAGCSAKPSLDDIAAAVRQNVPSNTATLADVERLEAESRAEGDSFLVSFKARLKTKEGLYRVVDPLKAAAGIGADLSSYTELEAAARAAPVEVRREMEGELKRLFTKPAFIEETAPTGTAVEWYGSIRMKKVVDKWVATDVKTDVEPVFLGAPRKQLPSDAIEVEKAKDWFADTAKQHRFLVQRLADGTKLRLAEESAARAEATAQREREVREQVVAAVQRQARQLPIRYGFRRAVVDGSGVLQLQSSTPMTIRLEITRGYQQFARDLQVVPGRTLSFGHLEGWGFRAGDVVRLTNNAFDPATITVP